jgi:hypothetical protein
MGTVKLLFSILGACLLGTCSMGQGSDPPMVVYHYENEQEYRHTVEDAADYCDRNFDGNAHVSDHWTGKGGDATFTCAL